MKDGKYKFYLEPNSASWCFYVNLTLLLFRYTCMISTMAICMIRKRVICTSDIGVNYTDGQCNFPIERGGLALGNVAPKIGPN